MFENTEAENVQLVSKIYESLNSLETDRLSDHFLDDAALYSLNDRVSPIEGKQTILAFFSKFFADAQNIEFELLGEPCALGNIVTFKHIDHFELDGIKHDDFYVSVVLLVDGKIKKWLGYVQED